MLEQNTANLFCCYGVHNADDLCVMCRCVDVLMFVTVIL